MNMAKQALSEGGSNDNNNNNQGGNNHNQGNNYNNQGNNYNNDNNNNNDNNDNNNNYQNQGGNQQGNQGGNNYNQNQNQGGNNHNQQQGFDLGGSHLNQPQQQHNNNNSGGGGGGFDFGDISSLVSSAQSHPDGQNQDSSLFSSVAGFLKNKQGNIDADDIDEDQVMQNHQKVTNSNEQASSKEIGNAAALNAIKSILGGGGQSNSSTGSMQQQMLGAAMASAGQLFDKKQEQGQASGLKEEAMQKAGEAVMKLMIKNQVSGMMGGSQSGGLGQLAAKFLS
ncbi:hypothetical protein CF336_g1209 [Tilletia laevis]|nr:hypothetical protein CF336_g1209 [Tilletia laevis]KAE8205324.1 hypothetical protein CF335_g2334 [Tilletia laevis]KAE8243099.1 hypothetical protein A4X03_0g7869 [Tilletia caries]CAD6930684.1 unnamed protein product [Tilletia caries]CAD7067489.1 unnamed protein product [Tilletia caries]